MKIIKYMMMQHSISFPRWFWIFLAIQPTIMLVVGMYLAATK